MKTLNIVTAKKIFKTNLNKINNQEQREFINVHTNNVVKFAKLLGAKYNHDLELLETSAWLHDIGYSVDLHNHAQESLSLLKGYQIHPTIKDCILNHGADKNPRTMAGRIFQIADKLSFLDYKIIALIFSNKEKIKKADIKFLEIMTQSALKLLKKLKQ